MGRTTIKHSFDLGKYICIQKSMCLVIYKDVESNREVNQAIPTLTIQDSGKG